MNASSTGDDAGKEMQDPEESGLPVPETAGPPGATKPSKSGSGLAHPTRWLVIGLILGIVCGLLFGDYCSYLKVIGLGYVGLLQMTVLPYLVISLVAKLGRLQTTQAREIGVTALAILLLLWAIAIVMVVLVSAILPAIEGAAFFSPSEDLGVGQHNFMERFIPDNVFRALTQEYVPAVVVFCLFFGCGLMLVPGKEPVLDILDLCSAGLSRVNLFLVRLAPLGLFTLTAEAAGTLGLEELTRLQAYLIIFAMACLLAAFGVLPALLTSLTPIPYRSLMRASQGPWLTVLATGKLFVALPQIIEQCELVLSEEEGDQQETSQSLETRESTPSVVVPLGYPFPHMGKIFTFLFISFAAWYSGQRLTSGETLTMAATGTISSFASPLVTLPYLLDQYRLPQDLISLFIVPGFITMRLGDVVGVAHLMVMTLIVSQAMRRKMRLRWGRLAFSVLGLLGCLLMAAVATRTYLASVALDYELDDRLLALEIRVPHDDVVVFKSDDDIPRRPLEDLSTLERIRREKVLRVGYAADHLPYSFFNSAKHLVGFDVELMHRLASRMGVRLEFVPYAYSTVIEQLESDEIDVAVGGLILNPERLLRVGFTEPYQTATISMVMRDYRRGEFESWDDSERLAGMRLGAVHEDVAAAARLRLPTVDVVVVDSLRTYFAEDKNDLDGVLLAAEEGAAWNVLYPEFAVVIPKPVVRRPVSMAVRRADSEWLAFLNRSLDFERLDGSLDRLSDYWVQGGGTKERPPRWCVMRDVLHWLP